MNATLLHAPRALAATVAAFALAIVIALIASAAIGTAPGATRPAPDAGSCQFAERRGLVADMGERTARVAARRAAASPPLRAIPA